MTIALLLGKNRFHKTALQGIGMFRKFKFEEELYEKLQAVPISTRFKMDRIGLQLSTKTWNRFSNEEKQVLCHLSVRSQGEVECYKEYLDYLLNRLKEKAVWIDPEVSKKEKNQWENLIRIPEGVYLRVLTLKGILTTAEWIRLDDLERYALYRLSTDKYSESQFAKALEEFLGISINKKIEAS